MTVFLSTTKQVTSESHLKIYTDCKYTIILREILIFVFYIDHIGVVFMLQLNRNKQNWQFLLFFVERAMNPLITGVTRKLDSKLQGQIFLCLHPLKLYHNINALFKPYSISKWPFIK